MKKAFVVVLVLATIVSVSGKLIYLIISTGIVASAKEQTGL